MNNFRNIKEFLERTRRRQGKGSCIYLTKEGNRMLGGSRPSEVRLTSPGRSVYEQSYTMDRTLDSMGGQNAFINR